MKKLLSCLMALMPLCHFGVSAFAEDEGAQNRILIAYFTWADNTVVTDEGASIESALRHYANMGDSGSGVDATSSASLLVPGNTAIMAGHIHDFVGGDLFSIKVENPYPANYDECLDRAADELDSNARPALKTHVENFEQYDTVFLGMPNWWYSCPMAILTFVEEYDFTGKTVIPFVAHGTGGISGSVRDMSAELPDSCAVLDAIGVYRPDIASCRSRIEEWLKGLGIPFAAGASLALRLTLGSGKSITVTLEDNSASRSLVAQLPLTLSFEDYNGVEKIAYLTDELDLSAAPSSCDPQVGTLAYYAPWGNLSIFYNDFRESESLIPLGRLDDGIEALGALTESFDVLLEKDNND
ncbi:MAG: cyclophilin-like fold protein [Eubacteriales bacterium]|nr:cyclophilin-like fold protein [Eubacteriales bacterium]MDD3880793.1 cyclophilin-like fold protein [Eubacteriales bacterium]MDD4511840.1 cyclophilin-like fold protein [Eubacteriales bacterium]